MICSNFMLCIATFIMTFAQANVWDNLWSNNMADRVIFPS